jgi:hypothetical protein
MIDNQWPRLLAYVTGSVNQRLLLQCEYLVAENRILRSHLVGRLRLSNPERCTLAKIAKRLGRKHLAEVACIARPDTILAWYRRRIARRFDESKRRFYPGKPRIDTAVEAVTVRMTQENSGWGYDRIAGAWPTSDMVEWIGREELGNADVVTVTYTSNRRYCGGLTVAETAAALDVSADTVMRDWKVARAWLTARLSR